MRLGDVCQLLNSTIALPNVEIKSLAFDSRQVEAGSIFFATKGTLFDGHQFVGEAIKKGAILIVSERPVETADGIPNIVVSNAKKALAKISHIFYDRPSEKLNMVGVTGTNGKTTVTHLIHNLYELMGIPSGLIGTNAYKVPEAEKVTNTTPMSLSLNKMLQATYKNDIKNVIMEVSSHGIKENRVDYIDFDTFIFTNLTQDHLDYHKNMDDYMWTKMRPFIALPAHKTAIINIDDENGQYYVDVTIAKTFTYGLKKSADFQASNIVQSLDGTRFDLHIKGKFTFTIEMPFFGIYNVYNMLAAIAYFVANGADVNELVKWIPLLPSIDGRFDTFKTDSGIFVVVDYAHTPDAIENVLKSLGSVATGRILTVVGAGGDRDGSKRAGMGKNALAYSHHVIFTSDNPRSEDPHAIIYDMLKDSIKQNYTICIDRENAIKKALQMAKREDVVIILGKGHEKTQTIKGQTHVFCDKSVAQYIAKRNGL